MSRVPYANAVGSLMYAMVCTRPDLAYVVSTVSRFMSNPEKQHWEAVRVGTTISVRDCKTKLDVSEIKNREA